MGRDQRRGGPSGGQSVRIPVSVDVALLSGPRNFGQS